MWSNLCKLSPASGWNPNNELCDLQGLFCLYIFIEELRQWQPRKVIFFTGIDWFEWFFDNYNSVIIHGKTNPNNLVQFEGHLRIGKSADPIILLSLDILKENQNKF